VGGDPIVIDILVLEGDVLEVLRSLPDHSVQTIITSPPYLWLRNYGIEGQIGLEKTPAEFIRILVEIFREIWRVLRDDGTVWLNMGDSYAGSGKGPTGADGIGIQENRQGFDSSNAQTGIVPKGWKAGDLMGMPWRLAFALQDAGWYLRTDIVWHKPNPMPESNKTRPTRSHEFIFLLTKSGKPLFWTHPEKDGVRKKPAPDYYYHNRETLEDAIEVPEDYLTKKHFVDSDGKSKRIWVRRNKWIGWNYFYDAEAIKEPVSESYRNDQRPLGVLRQRCNKKSKYHEQGGQFKPLSRAEERLYSGKTGHFHEREKKQDALGKATYTGFNARWKSRGGNATNQPDQTGFNGHSGNTGPHGEQLCDGLTRNKRDVWKIATCQRKEAHFASFPDALPEICIKAGTSEYGCCPACGAPYMRVLKKVASTMNIRVRDNKKGIIDQKSGIGEQYGASEEEIEEYGEERAGTTKTIGWRPTCSCNAGDPMPCVTLDPFMGRGTVALVSRELGRSSIGIELNPEYVEISKKNLTDNRQALDTGVVSYRFEKVSGTAGTNSKVW
jgi:site-specific DNA-methyltransferase (adenine-specific)